MGDHSHFGKARVSELHRILNKKNPKRFGFGFKSTSNEEVEETTA
jgi:hypothetical protein